MIDKIYSEISGMSDAQAVDWLLEYIRINSVGENNDVIRSMWPSLGPVELRAVAALHAAGGRVLSRSRLEEHMYDMDADIPQPNTVRVIINHVRNKIGKERIITEHIKGYRLSKATVMKIDWELTKLREHRKVILPEKREAA